MTKEFFEDLMKIPTASNHEDMMVEFLLEWAKKHGCQAKKDGRGNVFMTKGSAKFYPGFCNHIDSVHHDQEEMVKQKAFKEIIWSGDKVSAKNPLTGKQTGLGMDDQGGCVISLAVIDQIPAAKAAFFVGEEIGMVGSRAADLSFFNNAAYVFSNDSPDRNRATHYSSGTQLYSDEFFEKYLQPICAKHGVTTFNSEPFTDIIQVRKHTIDGKHLETFNFGNGGYHPHQDSEYASFSDVNAAEALLLDLVKSIPTDVQHLSDIGEEPRRAWSWPSASNSAAGDQMEFDFDNDVDFDLFNQTNHDETDLCHIWLMFDDEEQQENYKKMLKDKEIDVEYSDAGDLTGEIFGELQHVKLGYVLWFDLSYEQQYTSWADFEEQEYIEDFFNDVVFEDDIFSVDDDTPAKSIDDTQNFWDFIKQRKEENRG